MELYDTKWDDNESIINSINQKSGSYESQLKRLEDNIRDHLDIIQSVNTKVNSVNDANEKLKKDVYEKLLKLEQGRAELLQSVQPQLTKPIFEMEREDEIRKFFDDLDKLKVDLTTYKELTNQQISSIDMLYKEQIKDLHSRVVEFEGKIGLTVSEYLREHDALKSDFNMKGKGNDQSNLKTEMLIDEATTQIKSTIDRMDGRLLAAELDIRNLKNGTIS